MSRLVRISIPALLAVILSTTLIGLVGLTQASVTAGLMSAAQTATQHAPIVATPGAETQWITPSQQRDISQTTGVASLEGQVAAVVTAESLNGLPIAVQSMPSQAQITLQQGRMPTSTAEAVLVPSEAKPLNVTVGSRLRISGAGGTHQDVTLVGIGTGTLGSVENTGLPTLLGTLGAVQQWTGHNAYTRLLISINQPAADVIARLWQTASLRDVQIVAGPTYTAHHASDYAPGARTLSQAMALMVMVTLVAAFVVIANTFSLRTARDTRHLAMLRCLGATRRQVFSCTLMGGLATGVLGSAIGTVLAGGIAMLALSHLPGGLALRPTAAVPERILTLAAGILITVLAALHPAARATRVSPIEALRSHGAPPGPTTDRIRSITGMLAAGTGLALVAVGAANQSVMITLTGALVSLAGVLAAAPLLFSTITGALARVAGRRATQAASSLARNLRRAGATSVAVWFGVTVVTTVVVGAATASATMIRALDENTPADVMVTAPDAADLSGRLAALPQVAAATPVRSTMVTAMVNGQEQLMTVAAWSPELPNVLRDATAAPRPAAGTIQLPPTASTPNGSSLKITFARNSMTLRVVTISGAPGLGLINPTDYDGLRQGDFPNVWVKLQIGADEQSTLDTIATVSGPSARLTSPGLRRIQIQRQLHAATTTTVALLSVIVLISLVGMANTLSLSVLERTREIGLMRALGALRRQVRHLIVAEALLTTSAATVLGLAFGIICGLGGIWSILSDEQLAVVPTIPWLMLGAVVLASVPCAVLASLLPARRAAQISPISALASIGE